MKISVVGTGLELNAKFEDLDRNFADPSFIRMTVIDPTGKEIDLSHLVQRRAIGDYFLLFVPTTAGYHQYRFAGYGDVVAANEGEFYAQTSFAYATVMFPGTGSITYEPQPVTIVPTLSIFITPGAGAISIYGQVPGLGNPVIVPDTGNIGIASDPPVLSFVAGLQPVAGFLGLTGYPPQQGLGVLTTPGAMQIVGNAPVLSYTFAIIPGTGSINVAGSTPNLNGKVQITPNAGVIALQGYAPGQGMVVQTQTGAITLAATAPVINYSASITPLVGAITVNGIAGVRVTAFTIAPLVGGIVLTGAAPTDSVNAPRIVNAGAVTLAGQQAVVQSSSSITPGTGAIGVTGNAPLIGFFIKPNTGAIALTGIAPVLGRGTVMAPNVGGISLTPIAAAVFRSFTIQPQTGAIAISGQPAGPGSGGTFTHVLDNFTTNITSDDNVSISASQFTVGALGIALISWDATGGKTILFVHDDFGNVWIPTPAGRQGPSSDNQYLQAYYCANIASAPAPTGVLAGFSGAVTARSIYVTSFTVSSGTPVLDQETYNAPGGASAAPTVGPLTPSVSNCLMVGWMEGNASIAAGATWTSISISPDFVCAEYFLQTTPTSKSAVWTQTSGNYGATLLIFKSI